MGDILKIKDILFEVYFGVKLKVVVRKFIWVLFKWEVKVEGISLLVINSLVISKNWFDCLSYW